MYNNIQIPVYAINLKTRPERLTHIQKEFENKPEFCLHIVEACEHKIGAVGLWQSMVKCVNMAIENDDDVMIICEDDHCFTPHYNKEIFIGQIIECATYNCDVLTGGISGANYIVPIHSNLYWVGNFWSTQFIVIYKSLYNKILNAFYNDAVKADDKISEITSNKIVTYPFISIQKNFGYSDCTIENELIEKRIENGFLDADKVLNTYKHIYTTYMPSV